MVEIFQKGMKFYQKTQQQQDMEIGVVAAEEASSSPARALQKLNSVPSENLNDSLTEIFEEMKVNLENVHKIMLKLRPTEQPSEREEVWLEEVDNVCGYTISVIEDNPVESVRQNWFKRHGMFDSKQCRLKKKMGLVKMQTEGMLRRGLTYSIGDEESVGLAHKFYSINEAARLVELSEKMFSRFVPVFVTMRLIYYIVCLIFFRLVDIAHLSPFPVFLSLVIIVVVALAISITVDLQKAKPGEKMKTLLKSIFLDHFLTVVLGYLVPFALIAALFCSVLVSIIALFAWAAFEPKFVNIEMESIRRELALMHAFLECTEGENERQRIWVKQIRAVAEQAEPLVAKCEQEMDRYKQATVFQKLVPLCHLHVLSISTNDVLLKMHTISERKINYCIPNIQEREGLVSSLGQSTQGNGSESHNNDSNSGGVEEPLISATGSNSYPASTKLQRQVQSIREEGQLMEALSKDAQEMQELDDRCKIWVDEMRSIAGEIKHMSEEYATRLEGKPLHFMLWNCSPMFLTLKMIARISNRIQDASRRRKAYGVFGLRARAASTSVVQ